MPARTEPAAPRGVQDALYLKRNVAQVGAQVDPVRRHGFNQADEAREACGAGFRGETHERAGRQHAQRRPAAEPEPVVTRVAPTQEAASESVLASLLKSDPAPQPGAGSDSAPKSPSAPASAIPTSAADPKKEAAPVDLRRANEKLSGLLGGKK